MIYAYSPQSYPGRIGIVSFSYFLCIHAQKRRNKKKERKPTDTGLATHGVLSSPQTFPQSLSLFVSEMKATRRPSYHSSIHFNIEVNSLIQHCNHPEEGRDGKTTYSFPRWIVSIWANQQMMIIYFIKTNSKFGFIDIPSRWRYISYLLHL